MDKKIGQIIKDTMGKGEKIAPVKSIKLKVKFDKSDTNKDMAKSKKGIVKKAVKDAKKNAKFEESAKHEATESPDVEAAEGEDEGAEDGMGGPSKKYKNLAKK